MEMVIPSFQYEPIIFTLKPETSDEEEEKGNIDGVRPSSIKAEKDELANFKGGKDSP